jgi:DNA-binding GntR family transcriptional regulator
MAVISSGRRADTTARTKRRAPALPPRRQRSLTDRVYDLLRTDILSCVLEPGRETSEAELAERFSVSKTPVREALAKLRAEGFVRTFPRRGYQVVPITIADMNDLFDVRAILEAGAVELACQRIGRAELENIQRLADVSYDQGARPSLKVFVQANREFHAAIARASGSERLSALLQRTLDELERFFFLGARLRDIGAETRDDHRAIVDILRAGDPAAARALMIRHNEATRRGLFQSLSTTAGLTAVTL